MVDSGGIPSWSIDIDISDCWLRWALYGAEEGAFAEAICRHVRNALGEKFLDSEVCISRTSVMTPGWFTSVRPWEGGQYVDLKEDLARMKAEVNHVVYGAMSEFVPLDRLNFDNIPGAHNDSG